MSKKILFLFLFIGFTVLGQNDMQPGFKLLETGQFEDAETFFKSYLERQPNNKTAQICYGRAVGLSGNPLEANTLFSNLLDTYPGDFEIQINYNESFLWAKEFKKAKPLYKKLVEEYPENFGAVLGYANTLSNLKEYQEATDWVNRALEIDPNNESAKTSRKYIYMGHANEHVNNQKYEIGKKLLNKIFNDFPEDKDALLNLANLYLIIKEVDSAIHTYRRYATSPKDSITALNGIALAYHIGEKDKEALRIAKNSREKVMVFKDYELKERTHERYVQALIWNRKYGKAKEEIKKLETQYKDRDWIYSLRATLGMYTSNFKMSINNYNAILVKDSASFDGNLGKANALFASDKIIPSYKAAFQTLEIFKNQKDALSFIEKLNTKYTPYVEEVVKYTFDNGKNTAFSSNTTASVPLSTKLLTTLSYEYRTTENTLTLNKANSHVILAGATYKLLPKTNIKALLGINNSRSTDNTFTQPIMDFKLQLQPLKLQNIELGYQREVQSFNADLIEREIVLNHYGLAYNLGTNINLGWYTQAIHTQQTDDNTRNLVFTSLYYNIMRKPALKMGLNYQYLSFKDQVPTIYFSPSIYQAVEIFADIRGDISEKTKYMASAATGIQKVEQDDKTSLFRAEIGLQHQFSKRFSSNLYGKYSNIASATAAGFEFTEIGLKLKWLLTKKPLFYKKLND
ncbi:tetratricopeptide (TPR) repeat protein [Saonia flava]|uniref:Tetratricopeptide (TPR) repeat protein n=1 Tax=Saonia flava TaxID=523696 RepID=A0A846QSB8_9FLAO|nr:tetratricopeptide repeat protein [Saonia flava]NJB71041.1 tetratricopeptide (TPR) repeat protein [Saonia flava]